MGLLAPLTPRHLAANAIIATLVGTIAPVGVAFASSPAQLNEALAFSRCMRSHGVPDWPDPTSSGSFPASSKHVAESNPRFPSAQSACRYLLPNGALPPGGQPTQAELRNLERKALQFARCMRTNGVPNWPDYTLSGGIPIFDLHRTTIDPNSPQIMVDQLSCKSRLHLTYSPPTSGGA